MTATYTKLNSGEWGVRVVGKVKEGDTVTVTKRDGSRKTETVKKVVWSGNGISLCAVATGSSSYAPKSGKRSGGLSEEDRCEVCDRNKWTCGHCVGW